MRTSQVAARTLLVLLLFCVLAGGTLGYLELESLSPLQDQQLNSTLVPFQAAVIHNLSQVTCNLSVNGVALHEGILVNGTAGDNSTLLAYQETLAVGNHSWQTSCTDGSTQGTSGSIDFSVAENTGPTVLSSEPSNGTHLNDANPTLRFSAADADGLANCSILVDDQVVWSVESPAEGVIEADVALSEGDHTWKASCWDEGSPAASGESEERDLTIDLTVPTVITLIPGAWHNTTLEATVFNVTSLDASTPLSCDLLIDGLIEESFTIEPTNPSEKIPVLLSEGTHTFQSSCTDLANNTGNSATGKVTRYDMTVGELLLQVGSDAQSYTPGEPIDLLVNATSGSQVNVVIERDGQVYYNYTYTHSGSGGPPGIFLNTPGSYTIKGYLQYLELEKSSQASFEIVETDELSCTITADQNAAAGEAHDFTGNAQGSEGSVSYSWDFNEDGQIDSVGKESTHTYSTAGIRNVVLHVEDSGEEANCSILIQTEQTHTLSMSVLSNLTGSPLHNAQVEVDDVSAHTGTDGTAQLSLTADEHFMLVSLQGYHPHVETIDIVGDKSMVVRLQPKIEDIQSPIISSLSPAGGDTVSGNPIDLTFSVLDQSTTRCTVFFSPFTGWWSVEDDTIVINPNGNSPVPHTHRLTADNISSGTYYWKVRCEDANGRLSETDNLSFSHTGDLNRQVVAAAAATGETLRGSLWLEDTIKRIGEAIDEARNLDPGTELVHDLLKISESLDQQKTKLIQLRNDYRYTFPPEQIEETPADLDRFEDTFGTDLRRVEAETFISADIIESERFIKYETVDTIEDIARVYLEFRGLSLTAEQLEGVAASLDTLQAQVTFTSHAYHVEVELLNGEQKDITLVERSMSFANQSTLDSKSVYLESIPKDVVDTADKIIVPGTLRSFQVIDKDPVLRLYPDQDRLVYYTEGHIPIDDIKRISTLVLDPDMITSGEGGSVLTGFTVLERRTERTTKTYLMWGIIISLVGSVILSQVTGGISFIPPLLPRKGPPEAVRERLSNMMPKSKNRKSGREGLFERMQSRKLQKDALRETDYIVEEMEAALDERRHDDAKRIYGELCRNYKDVPDKYKDELREIVEGVCGRLNILWTEELIREASDHLLHGNIDRAKQVYGRIRKAYPSFTRAVKRELKKDLHKLASRIQHGRVEKAASVVERSLALGDQKGAAQAYLQLKALYDQMGREQKRRVLPRIAPLTKRLR